MIIAQNVKKMIKIIVIFDEDKNLRISLSKINGMFTFLGRKI